MKIITFSTYLALAIASASAVSLLLYAFKLGALYLLGVNSLALVNIVEVDD